MKMHNVLLVALIFTFFNYASSQTVNGIPIQELDVEYIQVYNSTLGRKFQINIDFGKGRVSVSNSQQNILKDKDNQPINFSSMLDALNFLAKFEFELVQAYIAAYDEHTDRHYYILRRKKHQKNE